MAKITMPIGSTESRGRIGGIQTNTWRGISYAKSNSSPAQPRSKRQLQIRAWTTMLVRYWGTDLTPTERTWWNEYAVSHPDVDWTGNAKRLTGINWFVRCSLRMLDMGKVIADSPPSTPAPDAPLVFAAADGILTSIVTWTAIGGTDKMVDIWWLGPHSPGRIGKIERATHYKYAAGESATDTRDGMQVGFYTCFGRTLDEDNGLASPWVSDTATTTAA